MKPLPLLTAAALATVVLCAGCAGWHPFPPAPERLPARVVRISEEYRNVNTDLSDAQLAAAGITPGDDFTVRFEDRRVEVHMGTGYEDVDRGEWVGLIEEDGNLQLAVSFGHAADRIGCVVGDTLWVDGR